ncbi:hypothetical protein ASPWEDRAFT_177795 [Aspergillus wentii DTO 134E9]|uniref:Uncharacterized protein n=1 Tax=Aspergillus wentii DTO 134E9 TaxID=1073089 RepID=A0A1L9R3X8_ASPWE|nr:uncharacterized protein ASPWEDRAFT_177795 [Aspergillus wentii DTO 134E9]KAI9923425.1 hypothetical protein MW887_009327 [Aspergillus wentii]OJJ29610.1 hypothetical protein ASPWEDRAFT_177795 [Aspergillus wentii DTO 134E9]
MPVTFLSLPTELRNEIYKYLVCRDPINPWSKGYELSSNLLSTNTRILHETSSLLYGNNCFDLLPSSPIRIPEFLDTIGLVNASNLSCIRIGFPEFRDDGEEVSLEEESLRTLTKIQAYCTNLKCITATAPTTYWIGIQLSVGSPSICDRALDLVAAHFRAITSLQDIVMEVYDEGLNSSIIRKMKSYGWTLRTVEPMEEEEWDNDRTWDEIEDDYYLYNDDDDDNDDGYDIDNDSDFWRRAAD